ncbi:hypothetical protein [Nocardia paucivorans]|uniref:hypothetical protein n=1 Tax=Nocardia paucivorans TaxID=114259 RepID=UPI00278BFBDF|nr:hypothetical protein [Nocardia paucivorans]
MSVRPLGLKFLIIGLLALHFREQPNVTWTAAEQRRFEHLFLFVAFVNRFIRHGGRHALMADTRRRSRKDKPVDPNRA